MSKKALTPCSQRLMIKKVREGGGCYMRQAENDFVTSFKRFVIFIKVADKCNYFQVSLK